MKLLRWKRFSWDLNKLPDPGPPLAERYNMRAATAEDHKTVSDLIFRSFTLDSTWGDALALVKDWLMAQVDAAFAREPVPAVVISHGTRLIAASAISTDVTADTNLISGPCVLIEYRNRGLGTVLLYHTLLQLRHSGLAHVHGIVKDNVPAGKFVYPKFESTFDEIEFEPRFVGT
jgi:N-acetylglutamate synthase-like GNAT family acetyltransferase